MAKVDTVIQIRRLARAIRRLNDSELSDRVAPRDAGMYRAVYSELEELRLNLLEKETLIASSDERTQQMIASVTHDLKTYIALISGYAECMQDEIDDRDYPALIRSKCDEMNGIVLKIISDAHESADTLKTRLQLINLREWLPTVLSYATAPISDKGVSISIGRIPNVRIAVSPSDFESVIRNVMSNAAKYTPEGGRVRIRFYSSTQRVYISVRDSGPGVSEEDEEHIFERYYTGDKARRQGGGTGVGLANAKEIMTKLGGGIFYRRHRSPGADFVFYLPKYSKLKDILTPAEYKLAECVLFLAGFPFVVVFAFFYMFYLAAIVARNNRVLARAKRKKNQEALRKRKEINKKNKKSAKRKNKTVSEK